MYNSYAHKRRLQAEQAQLAREARERRRSRTEAVRRQLMKAKQQERLDTWKEKNLSEDLSASTLYAALLGGTISQLHPDQFKYRPIKLPSVLKVNYPPSTPSTSSAPNPYFEFNYDNSLRQSGQNTPRMFRVRSQTGLLSPSRGTASRPTGSDTLICRQRLVALLLLLSLNAVQFLYAQ